MKSGELYFLSDDELERVSLGDGTTAAVTILGRNSFAATKGDMTISSKQLSIEVHPQQQYVSIRNIGLNPVKVNDAVLKKGGNINVWLGARLFMKDPRKCPSYWTLMQEEFLPIAEENHVVTTAHHADEKQRAAIGPTGWLKPMVHHVQEEEEEEDVGHDYEEEDEEEEEEEEDEDLFEVARRVARPAKRIKRAATIKRMVTGSATGWLSTKSSSSVPLEEADVENDGEEELEWSSEEMEQKDALNSIGFVVCECILLKALDSLPPGQIALQYGHPLGIPSDTLFLADLMAVSPELGQRLRGLEGDFLYEIEFVPPFEPGTRVVPAHLWIMSEAEVERPLSQELIAAINAAINFNPLFPLRFQQTSASGRPVIARAFSKLTWAADEVERELGNTFQQLSRAELPLADPPAYLCHSLHQHQRQALYWMLQQEQSNSMPPFFQEIPCFSPDPANSAMRWTPRNHAVFPEPHRDKLMLVAMCIDRVMKESRRKVAVTLFMLLSRRSAVWPDMPREIAGLICRYVASASGAQSHRPLHALVFPRVPISVRYRHSLTGRIFMRAPTPTRGGIMGDDMGLGKTFSMLALIVASSGRTLRPANTPEFDDEVELSNARLCDQDQEVSRILQRRAAMATRERERLADDVGENRIPTLIICPNSVMGNWESQLENHIMPGLLRVHKFHGSGTKRVSAEDLEQCDVVISTYGTLVSNNELLRSVRWRRVILDEAHFIRNAHTASFDAVLKLNSIFKWCVTGTPLVNSVKDIQSLVAFCGTDVISDPAVFRDSITSAIKAKEGAGYLRLRMLMLATCLRRTKDQKNEFGDPIVDIPLKKVEVHRVPLSNKMLRLYVGYEARAKDLYRALKQMQDLEHRAAFMFLILLRLRQLCLHPQLYPGLSSFFTNAEAALESGDPQALKDAMMGAVPSSCAKCAVFCSNRIYQTSCSHFYCGLCRDDVQLSQSCHQCGAELQSEQLVAQIPEGKMKNTTEITSSSDKIKAISRIIQKHNEMDPSFKIVIFSQFTSFLDILSGYFKSRHIDVCKLDGRMEMEARDASISNFDRVGGVRIMLASLKCAGVGVNLLSANVLILCDPWWNQASEDQAIDRVHRLGQRKPVYVYRLVAQDTIDERMLTLQQGKSQLANVALSLKSKEELAELKVQQMDRLFDLEEDRDHI